LRIGRLLAQTVVFSLKVFYKRSQVSALQTSKGKLNMLIPFAFLILQESMRARQPSYFVPVLLGSLVLGGIAWLIAAVLGFARARAFGSSTRWFSFAAVCLLLYHIQFILLGFVAIMGAQQNDFDSVLSLGAFFNIFVLLGAVCAVMGFLRLTSPPR